MRYLRLVPSVIALILCGFMLTDLHRWGFVFMFMMWGTVPLMHKLIDWLSRK